VTAPRILFIDDDAGLRRLASRAFERLGYEVETAADGAAGVLVAQAGRFAAICVDHYMPGQDGLATLEQIVAAGPDTPPVIYVTGSAEGRVAVAALRAGAADYVIKEPGPEFLDLLAAAIEAAIERAALRRDKAAAEAAVRIALAKAEQLAQSRALLLREVNHRVANSLQLLSSLARLQEGSLPPGAARAAISDMRGRIAAIAQVHRRLYTSEDVGTVALDEYLGSLVRELDEGVGESRIRFEPVRLDVPTDRAVSLGVIVSELVTNALKYAYPDGTPGLVHVRLRCEGDGAALAVEDDGVGGAPDAPSVGSGLGKRIVAAMAQGLGGAVEERSGPDGTRVLVRFPLAA